LASKLPDGASCLVLDIRLPGVGGLDFQAELARANIDIPIIFITGYADIPMAVRAMKAGAVDFLTKPVKREALFSAVVRAAKVDAQSRQRRDESKSIGDRLATLTHREREVLAYVIAGRLNKQIAASIGTVEKTVKVHRGRMMAKLGIRSVADLVRLADKAGIAPAQMSG
jgi:FixJ family two-component response regulator